MAKLKLNPDPTFSGKVAVHVPGSEPADVVLTFKHRSRSEFLAFNKKVKDMKDDVELIKAIATGWDLEDDFNDKNIRTLVEEYIDFPSAAFIEYCKELTGARAKN